MTIFVFSRRALQKCLDHLRNEITLSQFTGFVKKLNTPGQNRLPTMWEVVILDALSYIASLNHERPLPLSGRKPDFDIQFQSSGCPTHIIGDITTVSDAGLEEKNPIDMLDDHVMRLAKKYGLKGNHFYIQTAGSQVGEYRKTAEMRLALPSRSAMRETIKSIVEPFIRKLAQERPKSDSIHYRMNSSNFSIRYDQTQIFAGRSYPSYKVALSTRRSPIANAIESKADQLRNTPRDAIRTLIICDGDCELISAPLRPVTSIDRIQLVETVLRGNDTIDAVVLVSVKERGLPSHNASRTMQFELITNPRRRPQLAFDEFQAVLFTALQRLPKPTQTPRNASYRSVRFAIGPENCTTELAGYTIKVSSRALVRLLAGDMPIEEFLQRHSFSHPNNKPQHHLDRLHPNQFERFWREGRMIKNINVEPRGDKDDDWIEFNFGRRDAAAGPFV